METNEKEASRRRLKKWCKIFAAFLIFMWICTIISKSIYVSKLPQVNVQTPDKKYIEHIVEAEGIVVAGGELAVNTAPGLRVLSLNVQAGDLVKENDLLFCVDLEDLGAMISEKERELKKLKYRLSDLLTNQTQTAQKRETDILWAREDYDSIDRETKEAVERAEKSLQDAEDALEEHLETKASAQTVSGSDVPIGENDDAWQKKKAALEEAVRTARQNLENENRAREDALQQKRRNVAGVEMAGSADSAAFIYQLDIEALQAELEEFYALRKQGGEIRAAREGFVSKIQIGTGSRTMDTAAILLTDGEVPCQFKFNITREQGKYLHLGDKVKIKIAGASGMDAEVNYLSENPAGGYDMICRLPEKVGQPGVSGSIRKAVQGEMHNTVIPLEALYKEGEAYYIYVIKEKSGILGNESYVEKLKVRVTDQNERYAAIEEGIVASDARIVTYSSEELKQGASVRMME